MRLPILMYHKIDHIPAGARHVRNYVLPDQFAAQLDALRRWGYQTISFADWLAHRAGAAPLPRRPIILTFDDGYRSTHDIAWPLLRRFAFTGTVFLVSDLIGKTNTWDADEIQEPLLDEPEIAAMQAAGITFESHGRTHAPLTTAGADRALDELASSRGALTQRLGRPVRVMCYPYGKHNAAVRALTQRAGYEAAVVTGRRMNRAGTDPYRLARLRIDARTSLARLGWTLFQLRWLSPV